MNKIYFYPLIFLIFLSATKLSIKNNIWNFKDYDKIEYDLSMSATNEVNYLNQKNGVKVSANLIVDILDSTHADLVVINKKIIEKVNDSVTTYDEIQLEDDIIFKNYTNQGKIEGKISEEAASIKDIIFPVILKEIKVGESITEKFKIPFDFGKEVIELEVENVITKTKSEDGLSTYSGTINSAKHSVETPNIESMTIFVNGNTNFQFDNKKGVFLNQQTNLAFFIKGKLDKNELTDILTFRINQDIKLKSLK
ncbi:hypothetical protein [Flavivirga spongiicola]|uniref:Lipid/polyisoprenoid-binding YceI-like domain-containing protein n=1 Tax=Flavivirga spongiicola TaxID=421621 RepID=A0ABU7XM38_9FLAO|nr:hypothetical protein [Flavivirga sp. MEBiC05379]MDO5981259.1 hypothetical protein [Flavivirga sp. MEBiC05379]